MFRFANPEYFLLLILVVIVIFLRKYIFKKSGKIVYSDINLIRTLPKTFKSRYKNIILLWLRLMVLILFILTLVRPQYGTKFEENLTDAVDILIALDCSGSMLAEDFKPNNRLDAAKEVAEEFIKGRKFDRIGLVVFGKGAYLKCPLTVDYSALINFIDNVNITMKWVPYYGDYIKQPLDFHNATMIPTAIGVASNYLKKSKAKSKVIILVTDGKTQGDSYDPVTLAKVAATFGIKIYAIGIGSEKGAPIPREFKYQGKIYMRNSDGSLPKIPMDEDTLKEIADVTHGQYFRATDTKKLRQIYKTIDKLEKTKIEVKQYVHYTEQFQILLAAALILFLLEFILRHFYFKSIP